MHDQGDGRRSLLANRYRAGSTKLLCDRLCVAHRDS
jgi:hypothetical protein